MWVFCNAYHEIVRIVKIFVYKLYSVSFFLRKKCGVDPTPTPPPGPYTLLYNDFEEMPSCRCSKSICGYFVLSNDSKLECICTYTYTQYLW